MGRVSIATVFVRGTWATGSGDGGDGGERMGQEEGETGPVSCVGTIKCYGVEFAVRACPCV